MPRAIAKDHDEKRAAILKGAARVFAREGYARASMAQVAEECGVSKANLYHYHRGKDALLFEILDSYLSNLRDRVLAVESPPGPRKALILMVTEILFAYEGMDDEHRIQTEGMAVLPPDQQEILKSYQRDMVNAVSDILRRAVPDLDDRVLREATMSVFGMVNWFYMWNPNADRLARRRYANTVAILTLGGVRRLSD